VTEKLDNVPRAIFEGGSKRQRYQRLVIGETSWTSLLKYELIMMLACRRVGALGLVLRAKLYPRLLGSCGRNVFFGADVVMRHPHKIHIGDNVVIDEGAVLDAKGRSNRGITIGNGVFIGRQTSLHTKDGDLELEDGVNISSFCTVFSMSHVRIGANTLLAGYVSIVGGGHDFDRTDIAVIDQPRSSRGIQIGARSWIGTGAAILDGVTLGRDVVVGAHAVVTGDLPDFAVAAGTPARVLRDRRAAVESHSS
jgi:acetyltransferase-like isoleucine patch superfamily enzyme